MRLEEPRQSQHFAGTDSLDLDSSLPGEFVLEANFTFLDQVEAVGRLALAKD
jgi:hypothetical protein